MIRKILATLAVALLLIACSPPGEERAIPLGASRPHPIEVKFTPEAPPAEPVVVTTTTTTQPPATTAPTTTTPTTTTSTPVATTTPQPVTVNCGVYLDLVATYFPASQVAKACAVMLCESHGHGQDPLTIFNLEGSGASGLFQFMPGTWETITGTPAPAAAYPASTQIRAAAELWSQQGWVPWACA